jgi:hypothetical protein
MFLEAFVVFGEELIEQLRTGHSGLSPLTDDQVFDLTLLIPDNSGYLRLANIAYAQFTSGIFNLHAR